MLTPWDIPPNVDNPSPRFVKPIPANDLRAIFGDPDPADDDRPDLYALLGAERRDRLPTRRSFAFASSLLLWLTIGGCVWLIVSGRL